MGSPLETPAELAPFTADAMLIADGGNIRPGAPSLTVALRGDAVVTVEARTLGCELVTADRGFARFPGLRWRHPLEEG